jgi:hypothetical protein
MNVKMTAGFGNQIGSKWNNGGGFGLGVGLGLGLGQGSINIGIGQFGNKRALGNNQYGYGHNSQFAYNGGSHNNANVITLSAQSRLIADPPAGYVAVSTTQKQYCLVRLNADGTMPSVLFNNTNIAGIALATGSPLIQNPPKGYKAEKYSTSPVRYCLVPCETTTTNTTTGTHGNAHRELRTELQSISQQLQQIMQQIGPWGAGSTNAASSLQKICQKLTGLQTQHGGNNNEIKQLLDFATWMSKNCDTRQYQAFNTRW